MIYLLILIAASAFAQPSAFNKVDIYPTGSTPGPLRLFENRANGSNYAGIKARTTIASDCLWEISDVGIYPCGDGLQTIGDPSFRVSHVYSAAATISGSGTALSITGSTSGSALDITGTGGGRAYSFYATQRMLAGTNGYYVTPDGIAQNVVIDTSRNATLANITFDSGSVRNIGSAGTRAAGMFSDALYAYGTGAAVISVPNSTVFNALNIANGGGAALTWFATNALNTTGTINVGATIGTLATVIDNSRNITANNVAAAGTFRLGTSTTSGWCLIADASGFGTWRACSGGGISSLNGLTGATQTFAVGTSGTDFAINSSGTAHTFNIPNASASNRGLVTTSSQTFGGAKTFNSAVDVQSTLTASSGTSPAISVSSATAFNALNIANGGGAALTWFATNALNTTGTINVGASIFSLSTVIDNSRNISANNITTGGTFRYGVSTTSGNVFTADASGFGTWQALPVASGSVAGIVSTGTQTFAGAKTFSSSPTFSAGLSTNSSSSSTIYVGSGNFYLRTFLGGAPSCAGVTNGWAGVDTTGGTVGRLYICNGGNARYVDLN